MGSNRENGWLTTLYAGKKCLFCGARKPTRTRRGYLKCRKCLRQKSLKRLRKELVVLSAFRRQQTARLTALDLDLDYKAVKRIFNNLRLAIVRCCEREGRALLSGQIELDEAYFGGRRKGKQGRGASGKSIVFGLLERKGRVYTKVVDKVSAPVLLDIMRAKTWKGSVYRTDQFRGYNSVKRYGKHFTITHTKEFARRGRKYHSHINGIEGFWSFAKHGLYNYRGVSKSNFPLYLKEMEFRYNHRHEPLLPLLVHICYSGYEVTSLPKKLIIEDEASLLQILAEKLGKEGFLVFRAKNGIEGFALAAKEKPDLVLMDILMPKMHGYECLSKIRAEEWGKKMPVILLSNLSKEPKAREIVQNDKQCDYWVKADVSMAIIIERIKEKLHV